MYAWSRFLHPWSPYVQNTIFFLDNFNANLIQLVHLQLNFYGAASRKRVY